MSYAERAYFIHFPLRYDNSVKVSLLQDGYAGFPVETKSKLQLFNLEYEESPSLTKPILPSALTAYFAAPDQQFIDDLVNAAEQQFLLQIQIGLDVVWRGFVRPGLTDVREIESPKLVGITAVDGIALMEKNFFSRGDLSRRTIDAVLTDLLGSYEDDLSGWDSIELRQISADATKTIFELAHLNPEPFYSGDPSDPQPLNQRFVLEQILSRFSSRAMYWEGWKIDSIDTQKSWQPAINVTTQDFGTDLETSYLPAYGQAKLEYLHRAGARIFEVDPGQEYNDTGFTQTINFSVNGGEAFSIDGYVQASQSTITGFDIGLPTYFEISLTTPTHYWDYATRKWRVGSAANRFNIFDLPLFSTVPIRGRYRLEVSTPPLATTQITLAISAIKQEGGSSSSINTYTFEAAVNDYSIIEGDTEVLYGIQSDANEAFDFGSYLLGDTVGIQTPTALTYSSGTPTQNWRNGVSDPSPAFYEPLNQVTLRTFLGYHKSLRKIIRGTLTNASYTPDRLLIFGGKSFRFCGGNWNGQTGFWQGSWIELTYETPTVTFNSYAENVQNFRNINLPVATDSLLYVRSVTGDVRLLYNNGTDGSVERNQVAWRDLRIELQDGIIISPADGLIDTTYYDPFFGSGIPSSVAPVGILSRSYVGNFGGIQIQAATNPFSTGQTVYIHSPNRSSAYTATVSSSSNDRDDIWNVAFTSNIFIDAPEGTYITNAPIADYETRVFYYDAENDSINSITQSGWDADANFLDLSRYTILWRLVKDLSISLEQGTKQYVSIAFEPVSTPASNIEVFNKVKNTTRSTEQWVLEKLADSEAVDRTIIASLSGSASGTGVTSLSITELNIRDTVKAGTTLWVYKSSTPANKEAVVLSADLVPGDATISIVSKDLSNSYSSCDKVSLNVTGVFSFFDNYLQDAPSDTKTYGRKDGQWVEIVVGSSTPDLSNYPSVANYGANQIPIANTAGDGWVAIGRSGIDNRTSFPTTKANILDFNEADYATSDHGHAIGDITGLSGALAGKEDTISPKGSAFNKNFGTTADTVAEGDHTHAIADITGLQGALDGALEQSLRDNDITHIFRPKNASYYELASSTTGIIEIKLPVSANNTMFRMVVRVYQYEQDCSFDVICGGYTATTGWTRTFAYIDANDDISTSFLRELDVAFYYSGSIPYVCIGTSSTLWRYPQIVVTECQVSYTGHTNTLWETGSWDIIRRTSYRVTPERIITTANQLPAVVTNGNQTRISNHTTAANIRTVIGAETAFNKNSAFNKNFGTTAGTVAAGNHSHNVATTTSNGFMSSIDKSRFDAYINNVTGNRILGRINTAGVVDELTASDVRTIINVANGANNYSHPTQTAFDRLTASNEVISRVQVNNLGHVVAVDKKTISASTVGAEPAITTLPVSKGGTGRNTFTAGRVLVGNGTGDLTTVPRAGIDQRTEFPPSSHTHSIGAITGLSDALDDKQDAPTTNVWNINYPSPSAFIFQPVGSAATFTRRLYFARSDFRVQSTSGQTLFRVGPSQTTLYYQTSSKLTTTSAGVSVTGTVFSTGNMTALNFVLSSDERLKKDIRVVDNALNKLSRISGYEFNWKKDNMHDIGVLAQELEQVIPEAVFTGEDGYKTVAYDKVIPLLIQAVKELYGKIV